MTVKKTCGYARSRLVPALPASTPKVCAKCDLWFPARPRESVCDGCVPGKVRTVRALKTAPPAHHPRPGSRVAKRPGGSAREITVRHVYSDALNLTFETPVSGPGAASLECRVLAYEAAARERWKYGRAA